MTDIDTERNAPWPTMSATYAPDDNKLRLSSLHRLDPETYARVKAAGFAWAPKLELFIAPMWTPSREDLLLELCGEIDDEDTTLVERAEARAERFDDYHDKREQEAASTHKAVERIMDGIPLGQPIILGHHSEKHARKDAQRIEDGIRKAVHLWDTAKYWEQRAKGALRHVKYKERPDVRARRIKTLEADLRKQERNKAQAEKFTAAWLVEPCTLERAKGISNYDHISQKFLLADYPREAPASQYEGDMGLWSALDGGIITAEQARALALPAHASMIAYAERWIAHLTNRLAYERTLLGEVGGIVADQTKPEKGGACMCWASPQRGWSYIVKVNKVSVSVLDNWGNGGKNFTRIIPFDKLAKVMTAQEVQALRDSGQLIEATNKVGFYRQGNLETLPDHVREPEPTAPKEDLLPAEQAAHNTWNDLGISQARQDAIVAEITAKAQPGTPIGPFTLGEETVAAMKQTLKAGVQVVAVEQLFPTPPALADRMVALAGIQPGQRVLEPSAGTGQILGAMTHGATAVDAVAIEIHGGAISILQAQQAKGAYPNTLIRQEDFLQCVLANIGTFDAICMNPPFAKGADTAHVLHALTFLRPGGTLVAITSAMAGARGTKADHLFQETMDALGADRELLPSGTFHDSGTDVHTALWVVRMPETMASKVNLDKTQNSPSKCLEKRELGNLTAEALGLSSGTIATLIGECSYVAVDEVQADFVLWCTRQEDQAQSWQDAWQVFWGRVKPRSLHTIATEIEQAAKVTQAQVAKERGQAEWKTKKQPRKAQAAPVGMFENVQGSLF